jgi:hypothetical protein
VTKNYSEKRYRLERRDIDDRTFLCREREYMVIPGYWRYHRTCRMVRSRLKMGPKISQKIQAKPGRVEGQDAPMKYHRSRFGASHIMESKGVPNQL